ncbi:AAA family ATPase [Pigmentiphaga soli]|uniref:AAA family ATPase n=1 Tax=Pigmentiphaga soli TaxID=1007095 RepID=A0ABP8H3B3_9BURK
MTCPVLTFFNNKGGVGKTSLIYHLAWMLSNKQLNVLVCDLDPQANLTAAFLDEDDLAQLWDTDMPGGDAGEGQTIFQCIRPLTEVGDLLPPKLRRIRRGLSLLPGDLSLSGFEDQLSTEWVQSMGTAPYRPFRVLTAFWQVCQLGAKRMEADIILIDVGPNLGAINRSALIASDYLIVPLAADLFSLQGLKNLGPTLYRWRTEWNKRLENWAAPSFELPAGRMQPLGYVVHQHSVRLSRPVRAYDRWINRIPEEFRHSVLREASPPAGLSPATDPLCIATLKHYRSLIPLSQEARKPVFELSVADGAIGSHHAAVKEAYRDFERMADEIISRVPELDVL